MTNDPPRGVRAATTGDEFELVRGSGNVFRDLALPDAGLDRKYIPVRQWGEERLKDPAFKAAYDALEDEFALAGALIKARGDADMTQEQVAQAMGTTQTVVARLESGRAMPSTRTLERFAKATRTRLRISFEPDAPGEGPAHR